MKNIVYKITFVNRISNGVMPYYYVGSKSNCEFVDGLIYDKCGKPYYGSSTYKGYHDIVSSSEIEVEIIFESDDYNDVLMFERDYHIENDVVSSPKYFNLAIATINNFTDPNYSTYKHITENKVVRLPIDHPMVISGIYVGVTKGNVLSDEHKDKIGMKGDKNPFYGRKHSDESKAKISAKNSGRIASDETRMKMSESRKGVLKTEEHKQKIGRKNMIMLKSLVSGECIRIDRSDVINYDLNIWVTPYKYKSITNPDSTKGKTNLINLQSGERIRINTSEKSDFDSSVWVSPQAYSKIKKGK